jgi:uncharacterized membrane protein YhhN
VSAARALLVAFFCAALADLAFLAAGFTPGHVAVKPLLMPLLAGWAARSGAPRPLVAALLCGWAGDTLLLWDAEPAFLAGMACFAVGHVCYLILFARYGGPTHPRAVPAALAYSAALAVTVALLAPGLPPGLRVPVAVYSALLTAMACTAAVRLGVAAGTGGALFMLSDTLIATGVADRPQPPRPDLWIMLTYLAAQYLLARGTTRARPVQHRPRP